MNDSRQARELEGALEDLVKNPGRLSREALQERIRQFSKQAIQEADKAERAGEIEHAAALYRLAGRTYRYLAELSPGDLRVSELGMAEFWETHAKLIARQRDVYAAEEEPPRPVPKSSTIRTPKPLPLSPRSSINREQTARRSSPTIDQGPSPGKFVRSPRKREGQLDDQAHDSGTFRKPGKK